MDLRFHCGVRSDKRNLPYVRAGDCSRDYESQVQFAYCSRNLDLSNLPTDVCGISAAKTNASGNCHFANFAARNSHSSFGCKDTPSFRTITARGRSCHFGCGTPITAASRTPGWHIRAFSRSTELIHSPPDLMRSLLRSRILT